MNINFPTSYYTDYRPEFFLMNQTRIGTRLIKLERYTAKTTVKV